MTTQTYQRTSLRLCQILGKTCKDTFKKWLKVYGEDCKSRTQVYEWLKWFKDGCVSVERADWTVNRKAVDQ